jgi:hypothetical protein
VLVEANLNAVATIDATYSAIVDCNHPAESNQNNPIESHETTFDVTSSTDII